MNGRISFLQDRMKAVDTSSSCTIALDSVNSSKNRYLNVIPCMLLSTIHLYVPLLRIMSSFINNNFWIYLATVDNNRVTLNQHKDYTPSPTGYINASFVKVGFSIPSLEFSVRISVDWKLILLNVEFWGCFPVYRDSRSIAAHFRGLVGNDDPVSLPCRSYAHPFGWEEPRKQI